MKVSHVKNLRFTPKAWVQMWALTHDCDIEISALGVLVPGSDDLVQEFYVPKQTCTGVSTVMDNDALMHLNLQLESEGVDLQQLCVFWHSHVNMTATPSGTDEDTMDRLANGRFLWSIITNKEGAKAALAGKDPGKGLFIRLDTYDPVQHTRINSLYRMSIDTCGYEVANNTLVSPEWRKEAQTAVVRPAPTPVSTYGNNWVGNNWTPRPSGGTSNYPTPAGTPKVTPVSTVTRAAVVGDTILSPGMAWALPKFTEAISTEGPEPWVKVKDNEWEHPKFRSVTNDRMVGDKISKLPPYSIMVPYPASIPLSASSAPTAAEAAVPTTGEGTPPVSRPENSVVESEETPAQSGTKSATESSTRAVAPSPLAFASGHNGPRFDAVTETFVFGDDAMSNELDAEDLEILRRWNSSNEIE